MKTWWHNGNKGNFFSFHPSSIPRSRDLCIFFPKSFPLFWLHPVRITKEKGNAIFPPTLKKKRTLTPSPLIITVTSHLLQQLTPRHRCYSASHRRQLQISIATGNRRSPSPPWASLPFPQTTITFYPSLRSRDFGFYFSFVLLQPVSHSSQGPLPFTTVQTSTTTAALPFPHPWFRLLFWYGCTTAFGLFFLFLFPP